jgi:predicted small metal-binding protein
MADKTSKQSGSTATSSNMGTHPDGINPSAPSVGTAGWGSAKDERDAVFSNDPDATRAGQMKGNMGDDMTRASQRASEEATTNKRPSVDSAKGQLDVSRRTSASSHSMNTSQSAANHSFRCADAGNADCSWETSGQTEEEVMQNVVEHARNDHGMTDWTDAMHGRARGAIRHNRAA